MDTQTYLAKRNKLLPIINKLPSNKKKKVIYSLGLLFGEYRHLKTFENPKQAYRGNPVFTADMRVENLDFWADVELSNYPELSDELTNTFKNAANEWYLKQFA